MCLQVKLFVNEAHLFNDAGIAFPVWPPVLALQHEQYQGQGDAHKANVAEEETMPLDVCDNSNAANPHDTTANLTDTQHRADVDEQGLAGGAGSGCSSHN